MRNQLQILDAIVSMATNYYSNLMPADAIENNKQESINTLDIKKIYVEIEIDEYPLAEQLNEFFEEKIKAAVDEIACRAKLEINSTDEPVKILFLSTARRGPCLSIEHINTEENVILRGDYGVSFAKNEMKLILSCVYVLIKQKNKEENHNG